MHCAVQEAVLLCKLRHPNIVTFMGVCPFPPCVVTEYCERGSLGDVLQKAKKSPSMAAKLSWVKRLSMVGRWWRFVVEEGGWGLFSSAGPAFKIGWRCCQTRRLKWALHSYKGCIISWWRHWG